MLRYISSWNLIMLNIMNKNLLINKRNCSIIRFWRISRDENSFTRFICISSAYCSNIDYNRRWQNVLIQCMLKKENWTTDECIYLSRLVEENKDVLCAKFGTGITTIRKRAAWQKITDSINSTSSTKLSVEEVEKKWHNVQMKGKAELSDACRSMKMTGILSCPSSLSSASPCSCGKGMLNIIKMLWRIPHAVIIQPGASW